MRATVGLITTSLVLLAVACYAWMHFRRTADSMELEAAPILEQAKQVQHTYSEAQEAHKTVTMTGPLATYFGKKEPVPVESIHTASYKPVASDHVGGSVVGTSLPILHDKFHVSVIVDLPFDVPAHAATPKLHGSFRSFIQAGKKATSETDDDVEFHVLNDQEFANFLNAKPSEALFSADATHNAGVDVSLPPTLTSPVTYHMVFLNNSPKTKKVVEADFQIDF